MNQLEFAAHIGKARSYITQLKNNGRLVMNGDQVDVEATMQLIADTEDPSKAGVVDRHQREREQKMTGQLDDMSGRAGSAYQQARAMREKYAAMQAKIAYEKEIGVLLEAQEVRMAVADGDAIIRNRLESLPDILAPQLAAEKDEQKIRILLAGQIEYLLDELSRTFNGMVKR
jgi:hypothetical protein